MVFQGIKSNTTWVKLLPEKYIYKADDSCNAKEKFYDCYIEALNASTIDCKDKCLPYQFTYEENALPFCDKEEFECGMEKAKSVLEDVLNDDYDKHEKSTRRCKRNCTIIQYKESSAWLTKISQCHPGLGHSFFKFPIRKWLFKKNISSWVWPN